MVTSAFRSVWLADFFWRVLRAASMGSSASSLIQSLADQSRLWGTGQPPHSSLEQSWSSGVCPRGNLEERQGGRSSTLGPFLKDCLLGVWHCCPSGFGLLPRASTVPVVPLCFAKYNNQHPGVEGLRTVGHFMPCGCRGLLCNDNTFF